MGIPSPKLNVPDRFEVITDVWLSCNETTRNDSITFMEIVFVFSLQPTSKNRGWLIDPLGSNPWWTLPMAALPALLCTILIFMDQQITAVIINRKEHKLKVRAALVARPRGGVLGLLGDGPSPTVSIQHSSPGVLPSLEDWIWAPLIVLITLFVDVKCCDEPSQVIIRWDGFRSFHICLEGYNCLVPVSPTERLWLSSGPAGGVGHVGHLFHRGSAVVCRRHRALHLSRQQPEGGVWLLCSRRTAEIPGHSGTADHRTHDLCPHGLFCLHDLSAEGEMCKDPPSSRRSISLQFHMARVLRVAFSPSLFPCQSCTESSFTWASHH